MQSGFMLNISFLSNYIYMIIAEIIFLRFSDSSCWLSLVHIQQKQGLVIHWIHVLIYRVLFMQEKKAVKEEKMKQEEKYMWAIVDGVKEKVT